MGFSGGGSNILKAHQHSSAVQDGGKLDMDNVTEAELTAGDIVYSDGNALQRLAIGTPAQQLQVNAGATAPEYFTPASAGSNYEFLGSATAVSTSPITVTFASAVLPPSYVVAVFSGTPAGGQEVGFQVNGLTGSNYNNQGFYQKAGAQTLRNVAANDKFYGIDSGISGNGVAYAKFFINEIDDNIYMSTESYTDSGGGAGGYSSMGGNYTNGAQTSISSITCLGNPFDGTLSCWAVKN